jgi:hypothetical protein
MGEDLEKLLREAWARVGPGVMGDARELARRLARGESRWHRRPLREWCLAVRASDGRIDPSSAIMVPDDAAYPGRPDLYRRHELTLDALLLGKLCRLALPEGHSIDETAKMLGTSRMALKFARLNGVLRTRHIPGRRGPWPILYADRALDPNRPGLFAPDAIFSCLRHRLIEQIPADLEQIVVRVPLFRAMTAGHRYAEHRHPELDGSRRNASRRLPPPPPDTVWYKWSRSGHYLGDDPSNWRKSPQDLGERPPRNRRRRKRTPGKSRATGG